MAYVDKDASLDTQAAEFLDAESAGALESQLVALEDRLRELGQGADPVEEATIKLEMGRTLVALGRGEQGWQAARPAFEPFLDAQQWEKAVEVCDVLYMSEQDGALSALGQGIWLGVTFPIDPELTLNMLNHVVEETPPDADGAAVAAAVGAYVVDLRAEDGKRDDLMFFANQILGGVARRHSEVESQEQFELWVERMELDKPEKFLVRMRNVVDVLVQEDWWFDRDEIRNSIPVN